MNVNELKRDYSLKDQDIICIALYKFTNAKLLSWSMSVGSKSQSANKDVICSRYFSQPNIKKLLFDLDEKEKMYNGQRDIRDARIFDVPTKKQLTTIDTNNYSHKQEITSDNIKQMLEQLIHQVDDPKDKLAGMIKVAEYVGLNKTDIDLTTPTIYLPQRCSQCECKTNKTL